MRINSQAMSELAQQDRIQNIRNIGIMAHIDAGKTTTTERILFYTGENRKLGNVDDKNTVTDWMEQEKERGITIQSAAVTCWWKGVCINIIDTPGHVDFSAEVERCLRVLDGAVAVFCAVGGVEAQSETVWRQSLKYGVPKIAFVNKMDRMGADFNKVCGEIESKFQVTALKMTIPIGGGQDFSAIIDVLEGKMLTFENDGSDIRESDVPREYQDAWKAERDRIIEEACSFCDSLMEKFLNSEEISAKEVKEAIRQGVLSGKLIAVFCGSSLKNIGVQPLLDGVVDFLPSPDMARPCEAVDIKSGKACTLKCDDRMLAALVFKVQNDRQLGPLSYMRIYSGSIRKGAMVFNSSRGVKERAFRLLRMQANDHTDISEARPGDIAVAVGFKKACTGDTLCDENCKLLLEKPSFPQPVLSVAIECESSSDSDRLVQALEALSHEDPTFIFKNDADAGQTIISGMGELHLDVLCERIRDEFKVKCLVGKPQITHRESVQKSGEMEEAFSKAVGDQKLSASVRLMIERNMTNGEYAQNLIEVGETVGKTSDAKLLQQCKEQLEQSLESGIELGYECAGVKVTILDVKADEGAGDSMVSAATAMCFDKLSRSLEPVLLEPVMNVSVNVPEEYARDCIATLMSRHAAVERIESDGGISRIKAASPLRELFGFATALRSSSQGKANFSMEFRSYAPAKRT